MDVIAYTVGGLRPGVLGPVPVNLLSFTLLLALLVSPPAGALRAHIG